MLTITTSGIDIHADVRFPVIREYVHKRLIALWRESTREFIRVASAQLAIDTGMSYAQFLPLGEVVRLKTLITKAISNKAPRRGEYHGRGQFAGISDDRSAAHGVELGRKAYELSFGSASNPNFLFTFKIVVLQYYLHENGLAIPASHHYQSLELGETAFRYHFETHVEDVLPAYVLEQYLFTGKVPPIGDK